jgi:hypothetical protein
MKFDPLTFSSSPIWGKKTILSNSTSDCSNLGLTFGRSENFVYSFSWYNSKSFISMLDTNGVSLWQFATPNGDAALNNLI